MSIDGWPEEESGVFQVVGSGWPFAVELRMVRFDRHGNCTSSQARQDAIEAVSRHSHVFLLCHGWNNSWSDVLSRYRTWITNLVDIPQTARAAAAGRFNPLFIGLFWPSLALPGGDESGPEIAALTEDPELLELLTERLPVQGRERIRELLGRGSLTEPEAKEVAMAVAGSFEEADWESDDATESVAAPKDVPSLWEAWQQLRRELAQDENTLEPRPLDPNQVLDIGADPELAGGGRWATTGLFRLASFRTMKDRAHEVGRSGGRDLLTAVLDAPPTPNHRRTVHLVGHSFGCKVLLSALCAAAKGSMVDTAQLLQPATSARCFAADAGEGVPGGYRKALRRVRGSILFTWSANDFPLRKLYQLSAWRKKDLGDVEIAGLFTKYRALGGYGAQLIDPVERVAAPGARLGLPAGASVVQVDGTKIIAGHGGVATAATAQMLYEQLDLDPQPPATGPTP